MSHPAEDEMRRSSAQGKSLHTITQLDIEEEQEKIASYEAAFKEIKEATGVADVNEVIQKFITQEDTHKSLQSMTRESQARIDQLQLTKMHLQEKVARIKFTGGESEQREKEASEEEDKRKHKQQLRYQRLTSIMVEVKAGVQHLHDRLDGVKLEEPTLPLTDENLADVLLQCEQRLRIVLDALRQEEEAIARDMGEEVLKRNAGLPTEPPVLNNSRITYSRGDGEDAPSEEEFEEEFEEDVVERDQLKKQSNAIMDKATKKTKKRGKKKTGGD